MLHRQTIGGHELDREILKQSEIIECFQRVQSRKSLVIFENDKDFAAIAAKVFS